MKLGGDEVLMVPCKCCCFSARSDQDRDEELMVRHLCIGFLANSTQGRIQGGAKIGHLEVPSPKDFFFRLESYINKPNTVESFIFVGVKFRGFPISDKLVGI